MPIAQDSSRVVFESRRGKQPALRNVESFRTHRRCTHVEWPQRDHGQVPTKLHGLIEDCALEQECPFGVVHVKLFSRPRINLSRDCLRSSSCGTSNTSLCPNIVANHVIATWLVRMHQVHPFRAVKTSRFFLAAISLNWTLELTCLAMTR